MGALLKAIAEVVSISDHALSFAIPIQHANDPQRAQVLTVTFTIWVPEGYMSLDVAAELLRDAHGPQVVARVLDDRWQKMIAEDSYAKRDDT